MRIMIDLSDEQSQRLRELAGLLRVEPDELARAACVDLLTQRDEEFQQAAEYVLRKNKQLYERLS